MRPDVVLACRELRSELRACGREKSEAFQKLSDLEDFIERLEVDLECQLELLSREASREMALRRTQAA